MSSCGTSGGAGGGGGAGGSCLAGSRTIAHEGEEVESQEEQLTWDTVWPAD